MTRPPISRLILLVSAILLFPRILGATTYYVRVTGNDGNSGTSPAQAWATIDQAANTMVAGDVVYVGAGVYTEEVTPSNDGTPASPIQFIADTDGSMTGDVGTVEITRPTGNVLNVDRDDYIEFHRFKISGGHDTVRWNRSTGGQLVDCEVTGGTQGGLVVVSSGLDVLRCQVHQTSGDGIKIQVNSTVTITNCLIYSNTTDGIRLFLSNGTIVTVWNSTIAENGSDGIEQDGGTSTITNSIVAFNSSDGLNRVGGTMTHTYNLVFGSVNLDYEGTSAGTGELSSNPMFLDMAGDDFHIATSSPAINVGTNAAGIVDDDLDGNARPLFLGWDMGCYEEVLPPTGRAGVRIMTWVEIQ